jgi:hypothetical protein
MSAEEEAVCTVVLNSPSGCLAFLQGSTNRGAKVSADLEVLALKDTAENVSVAAYLERRESRTKQGVSLPPAKSY